MRRSGILMHITSLPSPYGIGTLGLEAHRFLRFLVRAGQASWQLLPLTPTGYGDSPYQSCSTFAGNPYLIDLDLLKQQGLLTQEELDALDWGDDPTRVDYGVIFHSRDAALRRAYTRFAADAHYARFCEKNADWLEDFALVMALKRAHGSAAWYTWEKPLKFREAAALEEARAELADELDYHRFVQFQFHRQWERLRRAAKRQGVELIGDVPIYVPYDSVEVWKNPELFQLDETLTPTAVAGCPPDGFSADGQLWGNPLYRWDVHKAEGYAWWLRRLAAAGQLFDVVRLDHFRGFEAYWSVPYGDTTARNGKWIPGPGLNFVNTLREKLPKLRFIAEDLGFLTPEVLKLRDDSGYPGMKVLGFAFNGREPSEYQPHNHVPNSVCYTGTHDNMTVQQWLDSTDEKTLAFAAEYMALTRKEGYVWGIIRTALSSVSELAIVQMQDYLGLGAEARMNLPGQASGNWQWRAQPGYLRRSLAGKIARLSAMYGRIPPEKK